MDTQIEGPAIIDSTGRVHGLSKMEYRLILSISAALGHEIEVFANEEAGELITTGQAAEILGVSRRTVARMIDRGELPAERQGEGHHRYLRLSDVVKRRNTIENRRREIRAALDRSEADYEAGRCGPIEDTIAEAYRRVEMASRRAAG